MRAITVAVVSLALIFFGQSMTAASHDPLPVKRILVLGDSLSQGFGLRPTQAYPALLTEKLRAANLSFEITNASQTGGTTDGGLHRLPAHLKRRIDIFVLELGINDAFRGVPIAEIRNNLQAVSGDPLLNQPDRVHPNAAGQKILAENAWRVLEPIAREVATTQTEAHVQ